MMNASLAFCILALMSSSVPPFLLTVLSRNVNESVSSSGSPFNVLAFIIFQRTHILGLIRYIAYAMMLFDS